MITELTVENLAIIERIQIALGSGFTALTGETGAGKSLLVDALELAFGSRADSDLVRDGAPKLTVHLVLDLQARPDIASTLESEGIELEDGQVIVQREVLAEGKSQGRINGRIAPAQALRRLGELVVDLHGQHAHQSLLKPDEHLAVLDAWLPPESQSMFLKLADELATLHAAERKLALLRQSARDRAQRLDMLGFQIRELEEAQLVLGERDHLESELLRLRHADRIRESSELAVVELLSDERSAYDRLAAAARQLAEVRALDPSLAELDAKLQDQMVQLHETAHELAAYVQALEADPGRLDAVQDRLESLRKLSRKYGENESTMLEYLSQARTEHESLSAAEENAEALELELESLRLLSAETASQISQMRAEAAAQFEALVANELADLGMEKARIGITLDRAEISRMGQDRVEMLFSANLGEPLRPLAKIASGGEASRVMLAIKVALAGRAGVPIMIFDEVDAGLGGQAAAAVARKLDRLGQHHQVITISHLPQIASRASGHIHVVKQERDGRMVTQAVSLSGEARVTEIARMIAGEELNDSARQHAQSMLGLL